MNRRRRRYSETAANSSCCTVGRVFSDPPSDEEIRHQLTIRDAFLPVVGEIGDSGVAEHLVVDEKIACAGPGIPREDGMGRVRDDLRLPAAGGDCRAAQIHDGGGVDGRPRPQSVECNLLRPEFLGIPSTQRLMPYFDMV